MTVATVGCTSLRSSPAASAPSDVLDYEVLIASGEHNPDALPPAEVRTDDLLLLQYTSGTRRHPKGAMHTHSTVLWNSFHQIVDYGVTADEAYLIVPAPPSSASPTTSVGKSGTPSSCCTLAAN